MRDDGRFVGVAGGLGFEPRLAESESAVLPLDDPPPGERRAGKRGRQTLIYHVRPGWVGAAGESRNVARRRRVRPCIPLKPSHSRAALPIRLPAALRSAAEVVAW